MSTPESAIENQAQARNERELWQIVGAVKLSDRVSSSLSSQGVRAVARIRDKKLYLEAGSESFKLFLNQHPDSPMSYDQFKRRETVLLSEGDVTFDLLNSLEVPFDQRKLLKGQVTIDGEEIQVGDSRCRLDDHAAIVDLIAGQQRRIQEQDKKIEKQASKLKKGEADFEKLKREARIANPTGTPTGQALLTAAGALNHLCEALESAPAEEKHALKDQIFDLMRAKQIDLSVALGDLSKDEAKQVVSSDELINDEDLDGLES